MSVGLTVNVTPQNIKEIREEMSFLVEVGARFDLVVGWTAGITQK